MPTRMKGARPSPRHVLAGAMPHRILGATPSQWIRLPKKKSMWNNATYGCCVTTEEAMAKAAFGVFISDAEVKDWATLHNVLNGAELNTVLDWMAAKGFAQDGNFYNDGGKQSVDYTNPAVLNNAIYQGVVKLGIAATQLESVVGDVDGWFAVGFKPDQNEDHCIPALGYGPMTWLAQQISLCYGVTCVVPPNVDGSQPGIAAFTWNTVGIFDMPSFLAVTGEAWLRTPTTIQVGTAVPTPDEVFTTGGTPPPPPPPPSPPGGMTVTFAGGSPPALGTYNLSPAATARGSSLKMRDEIRHAGLDTTAINWPDLIDELLADAPLFWQVMAMVKAKNWTGLLALIQQAGPAVQRILADLGVTIP